MILKESSATDLVGLNLVCKTSQGQCCGSGMFIPDPGSGSRLPPIQQQLKRRGKKFSCLTFFCFPKFHKTLLTRNFALSHRKHCGRGGRDNSTTTTNNKNTFRLIIYILLLFRLVFPECSIV